MPAIIQVIGLARGGPDAVFSTVQYLKWYDPNANDGRGDCAFTTDIDEAMRYPDPTAAVASWHAVPLLRPVREHDGEPNRPLTAFHCAVLTVP